MRVTGSRAWLGLAVAGVLLVTALVWSIVGTIEDTVTGTGVIVRGGGLSSIPATEAGEVQQITLQPGDRVRTGDVVAMLRSPSGGSSQVTARSAGRIVEILVAPGSVLGAGAPIATVEPDGDLEALVLVPATLAKQITPGMPVELSLSSASKEEFGLLKGEVVSVSTFPPSQQAIASRLGDQLGRSFTASGPANEARVRLIPDASSASGFAWTSRTGPPFGIASGTIATAELVVNQRRPISLALSFLK